MNEKLNIMEITKRNQNLGTFARALAAADLDTVLQEQGPLTVLAPSNEAFTKLAAFETLLDSEKKSQLKDLLAFQILKGRFALKDLANQTNVETLSGRRLIVKGKDGLTIDKSKVVQPDVEAANGVLHIVDTVVMPQDVSKTATA